MGDHAMAQIAMHVESHGDRHAGPRRADPRQQFPFPIVAILGNHGAVEIEHHCVATPIDRVDDCADDFLVSISSNRPGGWCLGGDRGHEVRTALACQGDEGTKRRVALRICIHD